MELGENPARAHDRYCRLELLQILHCRGQRNWHIPWKRPTRMVNLPHLQTKESLMILFSEFPQLKQHRHHVLGLQI